MDLYKRYIHPASRISEQEEIQRISDNFKISLEQATVLRNRHIPYESVKTFINPSLDNLWDPRGMQDAVKASKIILKHIDLGQTIGVYTDYDADGCCSGVVAVDMIRKLGGKGIIYANTRDMGYGICRDGIDNLMTAHPDIKLIVTTDNGIVAFDAIEYAKSKYGLDVVVTDHHQPSPDFTKTKADANVDPHINSDSYKFKDLCGAGVIWKVLSICYNEKHIPFSEAVKEIDVVAFATIADVVPIVGENRDIVSYGLKLMSENARPQWKAFKDNFSDFEKIDNVESRTVGFSFGPAVNSVSRMRGTIIPAIKIFFLKDYNDINEGVKRLKILNEKRKMESDDFFNAAELEVESSYLADFPIIIIANEEFFEGVVGILASKIKETYNKPCIVLTKDKDGKYWRGSGRSIAGYHIKYALDRVNKLHPGLLKAYGGHAFACGVTIDADRLEDFTAAMIEDAESIDDDCFVKKTIVDLSYTNEEVKNGGKDFFVNIYNELKKLAPFGEGFEEPVIGIVDFVPDEVSTFGAYNQHLKLKSNNIEVISWHGAYLIDKKDCKTFTVCGRLQVDNFGAKLICENEDICLKEEKKST